eukprot:6451148-Amphidinium_carterae.2
MMGRPKQSRAEPCHDDHYMDPDTSRHEGHRVEPTRLVTRLQLKGTLRIRSLVGLRRSVSGRLDPDRRDLNR